VAKVANLQCSTMVYDKRLIEHIIQLKKGKGEKIPKLYRIIENLYSHRISLFGLEIAECIIKTILILDIPIYKDFILRMITYLPGSPYFLGNYLRGLYWSRKFKKMEKNCIIEEGVTIGNPQGVELGEFVLIDKSVSLGAKFIKIGKRVHIAGNCTVFGGGELFVGDYAAVSTSSVIITATDTPNYGYRASGPMVPWNQRKVVFGKVHIKKDVFIGPRVVIFPNVTIGEGSVVVAGSVVTKHIGDWKIISGRPAKVKANRDKVTLPDV